MSEDTTLHAALQQVRRRANLVRDAALALDVDHVRETELPEFIAAQQEALTDLLLLAAEHVDRHVGPTGEVVSTRVEWPSDSAPEWPPSPPEARPWRQARLAAAVDRRTSRQHW
jgi:hypothetical protein